MEYPKITIITVCFNAARTIEATIKSVLDQNYPNLEYIIIDGVSTDGTLDIVDKYKDKITKIISEPDKGIYDAFNKGVALATGDLIGILNADDFYAPWTLRALLQAYIKHPNTSIFHGNACHFNDNYNICWYSLYSTPIGDELKKRMILYHPTCFVAKKIYQKYPKFDLSYKIVADWDWCLQVYLDGGTFYHINSILVFFRYGGISSRSAIRLVIEDAMVIKKYTQTKMASTICKRIWGKLWEYVLKNVLFLYPKYLSLCNGSILVEKIDSCEFAYIMKKYLNFK